MVLTIAAGDKVYVSSNAALGAGTSPATGLDLYICYQVSAGEIGTIGLGTFGLTAAANQRQHYGLSAVASGLPAGAYSFGLCGKAATPANWSNNEWGYTSAIVLGGGGSGSSSVAAAGTESVDQSPVDR